MMLLKKSLGIFDGLLDIAVSRICMPLTMCRKLIRLRSDTDFTSRNPNNINDHETSLHDIKQRLNGIMSKHKLYTY